MPHSEEFNSQQQLVSCIGSHHTGLGPELTASFEWNRLASFSGRKDLTPHNPFKKQKHSNSNSIWKMEYLSQLSLVSFWFSPGPRRGSYQRLTQEDASGSAVSSSHPVRAGLLSRTVHSKHSQQKGKKPRRHTHIKESVTLSRKCRT